MRCPTCKEHSRDKVIDSRMTEAGKAIRRRRECLSCGRRYTTKERIEEEPRLTVIKKDGTRMPFDRERLINGLRHACYKRPVPLEVLEKLVELIEDELSKYFDREVSSQVIGSLAADKLRELDHVAYVRFASVYREFKDLDDMIDEIHHIKEQTSDIVPGQKKLFD